MPHTDEHGIKHCDHNREQCDECDEDYRLRNIALRTTLELGREMTDEEMTKMAIDFAGATGGWTPGNCVLANLSVCPQTGEKLKCKCSEATVYCSKVCQKFHWTIHKWTCDAGGRQTTGAVKGQDKMMAALMKYQNDTAGLVRTNASRIPGMTTG